METETNSKLPTGDYKALIDFAFKYPVLLIGGGLVIAAMGIAIKMFAKNDSKIINLKK
jgi:hypothetical protein